MVEIVNRNAFYSRLYDWLKLISVTGFIQILIQVVGFASGILIIRILPAKEYALFTLANTMLLTMISLSDGGVASGVLSQGGKVWKDKKRLGVVLATGMELRNKFAAWSVLISVPVLFFLLIQHGANWVTSLIIGAAIVPTFFSTLSGSLLEVIPRLRQDVLPLQKLQLGASIGRISFVGLSLVSFPFASVALLAAGIPQMWYNKQVRRVSAKYVETNQASNAAIKKEILVMVKRILPDSICYSFSGQITIWILALFGTTSAIAQVGALGRLNMAVMPFSIFLNILILPRFAKLPENKTLLSRRFFHMQLAQLVFIASLLFTSWIFSSKILWLFGEKYFNLDNELLLVMTGNCLGLIAGSSFRICLSRGWVINPLISISANISSIFIGVMLFDVSTLGGVLTLNIFMNGLMAMTHILYALFKIRTVSRQMDVATNTYSPQIETKSS